MIVEGSDRVSANTYVAKRLWRWCREVIAGLAGVAVSLVGASSVVANMANGGDFDSVEPNPASLVVTPVHGGHLVGVEGDRGRVQLTDPKVVDGLHPGEAAYFGLALSLRHAEGRAARASVIPEVDLAGTTDLTYEVRAVADATQCRDQWPAGHVVVSQRNITDAALDTFLLSGDSPSLPLCIRVVHAKDAGDVETGSVVWRFVVSEG